jgi:ABC-type multidrug transport system fused ATPase/permease subunit
MTISPPVADTENQPRRDTDWRLFMRLASYAWRSKRLLIISIALLVPLAVSGAIQPILIGQAISVIRAEPTYEFLRGLPLSAALNILAVLLMLTITIRLALQSVQGYLVTKVGQIITTDIRNDLFAHVTSLAVRFFDRTPVGKLMTRLTSDVEALGEVFSSGGDRHCQRFIFNFSNCHFHVYHAVATSFNVGADNDTNYRSHSLFPTSISPSKLHYQRRTFRSQRTTARKPDGYWRSAAIPPRKIQLRIVSRPQ